MLQRVTSRATISYTRGSDGQNTGLACQEAIDRSIRRNAMKIGGENLQGQCLGPEWIAAYVDGRLTSEEKAIIESHLAKCKHCLGVIELVIKSQSETTNPAIPDSGE